MAIALPVDLSLPARIGRLWFQWRSFSPVPLFILLVALPAEFQPGFSGYLLALMGALVGEAIRYEESMLRHSFGEPYDTYQAAVPRWIPRFTPGVPASSHAFDLTRALRSERSTFYCMFAMLTLLILKQNI